MKHEIDKLVANLLLDERELYLPKVGTLMLVRRATQLLSPKSLQAPYFELLITGEERGVSLVKHIACEAGVTEERAEDIYNEYVAQSLRDGVFSIDNLCTIEGNRVQTHQQFEDMANPKGRGKVKVNPRTNYFIYFVATLCMAFALGVAGYVLYSNGMLDFRGRVAPAEEAFNKVASASDVSEVEQPTAVVEEVVTEVAVEEPAEVVAEPVAQSAETVEPTQSIPAIMPLQRGTSYAVWGVYTQLKNAEEAIAWLAAKHSDIEAHIYDYDERYMVALCEVSSRSECGRKVSALKAERKGFGSVWVYTR